MIHLLRFFGILLVLNVSQSGYATGDGPRGPHTTYNPDRNQFMVLYPEPYSGESATSVKMKLFDGSGSELLPQPTDLESDIGASSMDKRVSAVYNPDRGEYAIVHTTGSSIRVLRVNAETMNQVGSTVTVSSNGYDKASIGYDSGTKNYLVAFTDGGDPADLSARFYDSDLAPLSAEFVLFDTTAGTTRYPAVVGNNKGQFAIAFLGDGALFFDVRGGSGTAVSTITSSFAAVGSTPHGVSMAYNHLKDEYGLVLRNSSNTFIQFVLANGDGTTALANLTTSIASTNPNTPTITFNEKKNRYVIGYVDPGSQGKMFSIDTDMTLASIDDMGSMTGGNSSFSNPVTASIAAGRCGNNFMSYASGGAPYVLETGVLGDTCKPEITPSHSVLDFGETTPGEISELSANFKAELGAAKVGFLSVSGADANHFEITSNDCDEANMNELEECNIQVKFKPERDGDHTATLKFPAKDTADTLNLDKTLSLTGQGSGFAKLELLQPSNGEVDVDPKKVKFLWKKFSDSSVTSYKLKVCTDPGMTNCFKRFPNLGK
jgi:hypothetical protein